MKCCECGCGKVIAERNRNGPIRFKKGHSKKGLWWFDKKPHPTEGKRRPDASLRMLSDNPNFKGDNVGYGGLHARVKKLLAKPDSCDRCKKSKAMDLANKTDQYLPDLSDWWWLCRRCHMLLDNRMSNLKQFREVVSEKVHLHQC